MSKQIKIAQEIIDIFYPIGSVYISVNDTDPGTLFGGTWSRIVDGYLFCGSTGYADGRQSNLRNGTITADTTLTIDQMPKHNHNMADNDSGYYAGWGSRHGWAQASANVTSGGKFSTDYVGGSKGHNHAIPSTAVAVWKRTA